MAEPSPLSSLRENKTVQVRLSGVEEWEKSRVEGLLSARMQVAWPSRQGRLGPYLSGSRVEIGFAHGKSFFVFSAPVSSVTRRPVPLLTVPWPDEQELQEFKRRDAPRVAALMPLSYEVEGGEGSDHSLILSLSGSGLAFNARRPVSAKNRLWMEIHLPNATASLSVYGEVVQCGRVPQSPAERYKIRVKFLKMEGRAKETILAFVGEKGRALARRGMDD